MYTILGQNTPPLRFLVVTIKYSNNSFFIFFILLFLKEDYKVNGGKIELIQLNVFVNKIPIFYKGNAELLALQRLDETSAQLQKQGNYLEALECMERGLVLRQHFFGADSDEVWKACKTVGEMCNLLAMTYLQQEDFNMVLELLKKAEILTERDQAGRAATFNNLACYYRRQGKLHGALQYLQKALKIESKLTNVQNPADTHINACAVLSQLGRHQTALEHAQSALILLQEELLSPPGASTTAPPKADRIAVLAIAYHNIGVEQEFLKRYEQSIISYKKGVEVAERYLGAKHAICITLNNSLVSAKKSATAAAFKIAKAGKAGKTESSAASKSSKRGTSLDRNDHKGSPSPERTALESENVAMVAPMPTAHKPRGV